MAHPFPSSLPRPMMEQYGYEVKHPHVDTMNDRGVARRRRSGTGKTVTAELVFRFNDATSGMSDLATFGRWWRSAEMDYGTQPFTIKLLNGYDDVDQDCRIIGPYTVRKMAGVAEVSLPVELVAAPVAGQSEMQEAIDNYDDLSLADQFHHLVHFIIPPLFMGP